MKQSTQEVFTEENAFIQRGEFLEQIRIALKEIFVAKVRREGDDISVRFPNGQKFLVGIWQKN